MGIFAQFITGFLVGVEFDFAEDATYMDICLGIVSFTFIFPNNE